MRKAMNRVAVVVAVALAVVGLTAPPGSASADGHWAATGGTGEPAYSSAVSLVSTPQGLQVLVAGGQSNSGYTNQAWLYDPQTGQWRDAAPMHVVRPYAHAVTLNDGRVLVVGGDERTLEVYDGMSNSWSDPLLLPRAHDDASVIKLFDGRVLIAGGTGQGVTAQSLLFDPTTDTISPTGPLNDPRSDAGAALMADGRVLIAGGCCSSSDSWRTAEIYDPVSGTWSRVASMVVTREFQADDTLQLLADGRVLAVGGVNGTQSNSGNPRSAEVYDPEANTWTMTGPLPTDEQTSEVATLADGSILDLTLAGTASVFDPSGDQWVLAPTMPGPNGFIPEFPTGRVLPDGDLLVTAGTTFTQYAAQSLLYIEGSAPLDAISPSVPSGLTVSAPDPGSGGVLLTWQPSTDNVGVDSYDVYRDGSFVQTVAGNQPGYFDSDATPGQAYNYSVRARDTSGNLSAPSASVAITVPSTAGNDTMPPSVVSDLAATATSATTVSLTWSAATDDVGVTAYDVYRDGVLLGSTDTTTWDDAGLTHKSTYTYTVRARDAAGNVSENSAPVSVTTPAGGGVSGGVTPGGQPLPPQACQHSPKLCNG